MTTLAGSGQSAIGYYRSLDSLRLLPRRFLPDEIITARMTELADASGAGSVYGAAGAQIDGLVSPATGCHRLQRELALRADRPSDANSCGAGVPRLPGLDVEGPRPPSRTRRGLALP